MTAIRSGHGPRPGWPELAAGVLGALWRWRVELALLAGVLLAWRLLAGAVGPVASVCLIACALAGMLASRSARGLLARTLQGGGCGAGSGADGSTPACRPWGWGGCAGPGR